MLSFLHVHCSKTNSVYFAEREEGGVTGRLTVSAVQKLAHMRPTTVNFLFRKRNLKIF